MVTSRFIRQTGQTAQRIYAGIRIFIYEAIEDILEFVLDKGENLIKRNIGMMKRIYVRIFLLEICSKIELSRFYGILDIRKYVDQLFASCSWISMIP